MALLDTKHKKKSAIITAIILLLLLFFAFNYGMRYLDPPIEYGVAINFGDSNVGSGEPVEDVRTAPSKKQEVVEEEVSEIKEETPQETQKEAAENVLTNDDAKEVPVVKKTEKTTTVKKEEIKKVKETKKEIVKSKKETKKKTTPKPKPKPSKATTDALNSLLNGNASAGKPKGEGDDKKAGVKGSKDGDPRSKKYYGKGGRGSGGNYQLAGRKALSKPIKKPNCEEEGKVVVTIVVNKRGKVIKAEPGAKGTTNSAPCLYKAAKEAALQTKWNPDDNAPSIQKGTIIYRFSLSK